MEMVKFQVGDQTLNRRVEIFGDYYHGDGHVIDCIDTFLNTHASDNLDIALFLLEDVIHPLEFTLRKAVRDMAESDDLAILRQKKAIFILKYVIPRIYKHFNFLEAQEIISRSLTGILLLITELSSHHPRDKENAGKMSIYLKAKDFLATIVLQIWTVTFYEQGIDFVDDQTIPYLRQLAMLDLFDKNWTFAGSWEQSLSLLEERFGDIPRISSDKMLDETSHVIRQARNSIRCQALEMENLPQTANSADLPSVRKSPQHMYSYFPKCSEYLCSEIETASKPHKLRCYKCNYYHWCSSACQDLTEAKTHHSKYCGNCPQEDADKCRAQMNEYLNIYNKADESNVTIKCHACGLLKKFCNTMDRCSKCKAVHYCSKTCQKWDWNHGKHRYKCAKP